MWRLVLLLTVACGLPFSPEGAEPFDPPPAFADWWADMETCSGVRGDWRRIEWYSVPAGHMEHEGRLYLGYWVAPHRIYLNSEIPFPTSGFAPWSHDWMRLTVQHEMLHDLTGPNHGPVFDHCRVRSLSHTSASGI